MICEGIYLDKRDSAFDIKRLLIAKKAWEKYFAFTNIAKCYRKKTQRED